jgi:hypothetical protein
VGLLEQVDRLDQAEQVGQVELMDREEALE